LNPQVDNFLLAAVKNKIGLQSVFKFITHVGTFLKVTGIRPAIALLITG
jgi:hypothetical protein